MTMLLVCRYAEFVNIRLRFCYMQTATYGNLTYAVRPSQKCTMLLFWLTEFVINIEEN